jgi:hypothetical protein
LGTSISGPVLALADWVAEHRDAIVSNRASYDADPEIVAKR